MSHRVCNAILLLQVQQFNSTVTAGRLRDVAAAMGVEVKNMSDADGAKACISTIQKLASTVDIPAGLHQLEVKYEDIVELATNALKDAYEFTNRIQATHEEIVAIILLQCN